MGGRKDPPQHKTLSNPKLNLLHGEMRERGVVIDQDAEKRRRRRQARRRTTDIDMTKESSDTIHKHRSHDEERKRRKEREKKQSKSSNSVSFAKEISTNAVADRDERVKPLKSSLKNSTSIKVSRDEEKGDTSSSGVQSGSNNSDADSINQKMEKPKKQRSLSRPSTEKKETILPQRKTSSESDDQNDFTEMLRIKAEQRKQRAAEAKVEESERKLIEFAKRLSDRKSKLEDLHARLKQRKDKLKEREERLKTFESQIAEREAKLKSKAKQVKHHEAHLRHEEGSVGLREKSVTDKLQQLEARTKLVEVKEDLTMEINELARKQLYQSSWNMGSPTKAKRSVVSKSTESLDNLSDIDSDNLVNQIASCTLSRPGMVTRREVGLLL